MKSNNQLLIDILKSAIRTVDPYWAVAPYAEVVRSVYTQHNHEKLHLLSFGKAALRMTQAVTDNLGDILTDGFVVMKYGRVDVAFPPQIRVHQAGYPLPDRVGIQVTEWALDFVKALGQKDMLLCLISGGDSGLFAAPYPGISLAEKRETAGLLVKAGADMDELNTVRKHISAAKGGRLAGTAYPARVYSLILSDDVSDRPDVIASGPTAPDSTTYAEALGVIKKYGLEARIPERVHDLLTSGAKGLIPETPKEGDPAFAKVTNTIVGSNRQAMETARLRASELGLKTAVIAEPFHNEAKEAGRRLAGHALKAAAGTPGMKAGRALCVISGGDGTAAVNGQGKGGRNTELALAFALEIEGSPNISLLSAGANGIDGPTDAAGTVVDGRTAARARTMGLRPEEYLEDKDSYAFFKKVGGLLATGPQGTNVRDIQLVLIGPDAHDKSS